MFEAQLHGKLTIDQENLEDILTSNTFGAFKYVSPKEGLGLFLQKAINPSDNSSLELPDIADARYEFWKWLEEKGCNGCEPDVLIELNHEDGTKTMVLVEAKYRSGKSSEADEGEKCNDQLAREWENLSLLAKRENARPILIYVTADFALPIHEIKESQEELKSKGKEPANIYWLSWRYIPEVFKDSADIMLQDLVKLFEERYGLTFFQKLFIPQKIFINWSFQELRIDWNIFKKQIFEWRFKS